MKTIKTILLISTLLLLIGSATAVELPDLKTLDGYDDFDSIGYSNYTTNSDRYFLVEKITNLDDVKDEWFTSHPEDQYTVNSADGNIYSVADDLFTFYGYQEVVEIDGTNYMVSINQNSKLSPSEETGFLDDLKEFNKLNNLEPLEI